MRKIHVLALFLMGAVIALSGCSKNVPPDWYHVTGSGMAGDVQTLGQARLMAKRAAEADANRQLLEAAKGRHHVGSSVVQDHLARAQAVRHAVQGGGVGA